MTGCGSAAKGDNTNMSNRIAVFDTNMGEFEIELFEDKALRISSTSAKRVFMRA